MNLPLLALAFIVGLASGIMLVVGIVILVFWYDDLNSIDPTHMHEG